MAAALTVMAFSLVLAQDEAPVYSDKRYLLTYLDSRLTHHPVKSIADWNIRRLHVLGNMEKVMGPVPPYPTRPPDVQVLQSDNLPGFRRQRITYVSEVLPSGTGPDLVPAYLLIPATLKAGDRLPAVLCLHQTTRSGKGEPAGTAGNPNLHYGAELAQRGFVTLAPDYPNFGDYHFDPYSNGYASATMKAVLNHRRAIDVLQSLPQVDPNRIGVIGHSLGGHNALFLAAFESRIKAVVTSCGFTSFSRYKGGDLTGWSHKGYMPRIADVYHKDPARMPFDFTEVLATVAPRPLFINAPLDDSNFDVSGVKECVEASLQVYEKVFKARKRVKAIYPPVKHEFPLNVRLEAYEFLKRWLR